jgi:hypothetical protein
MLGFKKAETVSQDEAAWNNVLNAYEFTHVDEFDTVLLDGIGDGYFDNERVKEQAERLDRAFKNGESEQAFKEAWDLYHGSFDDNQEEVLDGIAASFKKNVHVINPINLNGTIVLFKDLGRTEQAKELIEFYVTSRSDTPRLFALADSALGNEVNDPDVRDAFEKKRPEFEKKRKPEEILLDIAEKQGWSREDIQVLSALSVDEYYKLFKENRQDEMQRMIWAALSFGRIGNISDTEKGISKRAREALTRIGRESAINARRVQRYGVRIEE